MPEGAVGGGSTCSWKWKSCAPGLSCHARALSCCSLTAEFAISSFLAVPPQKCWAGAGKAANRVARGLVAGPDSQPHTLPCRLRACGCRSRGASLRTVLISFGSGLSASKSSPTEGGCRRGALEDQSCCFTWTLCGLPGRGVCHLVELLNGPLLLCRGGE